MHRTQIDNHSVPPQLPETVTASAGQEDRFDFFATVKPFIELLLAIGNAIFLPSFFMFTHLIKRVTPAQDAFLMNVKLPAILSPEPEQVGSESQIRSVVSTDKREEPKDLGGRLASMQERIDLLDQRFKHDHAIVEDMKDLEGLNIALNDAIEELKAIQKAQSLTSADIADLRAQTNQLHDKLDDFCTQEGERLISNFHRVLGKLNKGTLAIPSDMREELVQTWRALENSIRPHLSHLKKSDVTRKLNAKLADLKKKVDDLKRMDAEATHHGLIEPLKLRNIGNSCYLDSVLQALAYVDVVGRDFSKPISVEEYEKNRAVASAKAAIQWEINQFLNSGNHGAQGISKIGFVLYLLEGPSMFRLREAIFKSGLHFEFDDIKTLEKQHDAAPLMDLFIDYFLPNCKFKTQAFRSTTEFPGLEFQGPEEDRLTLLVPLRVAGNDDLASMIHWEMHKKKEKEKNPKNQLIMDPKEGKIIDELEGGKSKELPAKKVEEFIQWRRFIELPVALVLLCPRTKTERPKEDEPAIERKDDRPVHLPADGIVDLAKYNNPPETGPKQTKYKIRSYIAHSGSSVNAGHYKTYVEINDKYYCCDDLDAAPKEISKTDFFGRKDAYMIVLERLPEEENSGTVAGG